MTEATVSAKADVRRWFYHWMALTCLAISVVGFMPTFFVPVAQGTFAHPPMTYLHGLLFFSWTIYFCVQTRLAATGRVLAHREWGLLGVALATMMGVSVLTVALTRLHDSPPRSPGGVMADFSSTLFFEICIVAALANVRRPEAHKRFMLLATISMMGAPIGRWYGILMSMFIPPSMAPSFTSTEPPSLTLVFLLMGPGVVASLLIVAAMVFDWRTRRRVSPIYTIGLPALLALGPVAGVLATTPPWVAFVEWLKTFAG